ADDHGYCWPKMKTIAAKCSTSERTVQRTIKTLLAAGLLKKDARFDASGRQVSNGYTLALTYPDKLSPLPDDSAREGDTTVTPGVTQLCQGEGDTPPCGWRTVGTISSAPDGRRRCTGSARVTTGWS